MPSNGGGNGTDHKRYLCDHGQRYPDYTLAAIQHSTQDEEKGRGSPVGKEISTYRSNSCAGVAEAQLAWSGEALGRLRECQWHWRGLYGYVGLRKSAQWGCMTFRACFLGRGQFVLS
jgi:hypothetical protein